MRIQLEKGDVEQFDGDMLVYFIRESGGSAVMCPCKVLRRNIKYAWKNGDFSGKKGETFLFYPAAASKDIKHNLAAGRVLAIGLGKTGEDINADALREQLRLAAGTAAQQAVKLKAKSLLAVLPENTGLSDGEVAEAVSEGLLLGSYRFDRHKSKKKDEEPPVNIESIMLHAGGLAQDAVKQGLHQGERAAKAACSARDMANEPGNAWTPKHFAEFGEKLAKEHGLECTVLGKPEMKKLGMGGLLGVSQGSVQPPKLVILRYQGGDEKKNPTLMLVGKGLTFDAGGISLKSPQGMEEMKYDMCGGAAVICAMQAIAEEKPKGINVVALIPASENLPSGTALKPGDIITHFGGITSEIVNTDAEGRLILADALAYGIDTYKPNAVIDLATLTGAVIIGLGHHRSGLLATNDELAAQISAAAERAGEPVWRLPLGPEYSKQIKSNVADIKNSGGKEAGTITAAAYLQEFVGDTPWAHLDIAGTAWSFTEKSYVPKGPSGIGVRTLLNFVRSWQPGKK
ncbi:leucyl aminopeptidase [Candidatus Electronema sp. JM]|uniref:leucyl aminopeptidase n=1 Tax=Candidatus Electronema sp. JM TaxID=3401571 RepID=UPI003AA87F1C